MTTFDFVAKPQISKNFIQLGNNSAPALDYYLPAAFWVGVNTNSLSL